MSSFEKEYYEAESFWEGEMLQDNANKERIEFSAKIIPNDVKSIADIGCGNGVFVNFLKVNKPELKIIGVDRSQTALQYVKTEKVESDIANIPLEDNSFDCVSCLEVIEHLPVPIFKQALSELTRIASKYIILSVPFNEKLESSYNRCPSCKSIFNHELHVRRFKEQNFIHLLDEFGFECVKHDKLNVIVELVGHDFYEKLFYPDQVLAWRSPICPICGYKEDLNIPPNAPVHKAKSNSKKKWLAYLTKLPKLVWPKEKRYYWILGLYKRKEI